MYEKILLWDGGSSIKRRNTAQWSLVANVRMQTNTSSLPELWFEVE